MNLTLYAAYGANTHHGHMARRCPDASYLGKGVIENWRLELCRVANCVPKWGACTEVGLWYISQDDLRSLDRFEGFPYRNTRTLLPVLYEGEYLLAIVYTMIHQGKLSPASAGYWSVLNHGYLDCGISLTQLADAGSRADKERPRSGTS